MGITLKTSSRMSPVSVFFILLSVAFVSSSDCPPGWSDGSSVGLGCLHYNGTALLVWTEAVAYCNTADERGALVEILTAEQMEFLVVELEALEAEGGETFWWTGGSSFGVEGDWSWPSSRETVGDFVWFDSQPVAWTEAVSYCNTADERGALVE